MPCKVSPNLAYWTLAQTGMVIPYAEGSPGTAKTAQVNAFARALRRPCYTLIGSLREPSDVAGYPYPQRYRATMGGWQKVRELTGNDDPDQFIMSLLPPQWVADAWDGRPWIVFLDELPCAPPPVQASMLRILAEKVVGDVPLPQETWFLAAGNPIGQSASGYALEPPMANRLAHFTWEIDRDSILRGWANGLRFPDPSFEKLPDDWEKRIGPVLVRFAAYHSVMPAALDCYPVDDRVKASGAYPSPRSWTNGGIGVAAIRAIDAPKDQAHKALAACIGEDAAWQYERWEEDLDLPDPEVWLDRAIQARKTGVALDFEVPDRTDKVIACLGSLLERVSIKNTAPRWIASVDILSYLWEHNARELVIAYGCQFMPLWQDGYETPKKFLNDVHPILVASGLAAKVS